MSCSETTYDFDLQGHRGARGLAPENTIQSFLTALDHGVDTIELDLVVSNDRQLVVSHEPWFHHSITSRPDGAPVTEAEQHDLNLFEMDYDEIRQFDVGRRGNPNFPEQQPAEAVKPLLREAVQAIEAYTIENNLPPVYYNMETKSNADWYGRYVPQPEEFVQLIYSELAELAILDRTTIQSFDPATLQALRQIDPDVSQAILVSDSTSIPNMIHQIGYTPEIWSPNYQRVTPRVLQDAHRRGMKVIPWTINETKEMKRQLNMGVDGIITDYPNRAAGLHNR
ncbi:MAG: glycerophosphodiester phosphodiesterase family protein [Balneolaceae bacterium]